MMSKILLFAVLATLSFSKSDFFDVIATGKKSEIDSFTAKISDEKSSNTQQAYLGTLKMKSADFQKTPKEKLAIFKEGKVLLEKSISSEPNNAEFRFLRLIIQENAPKMLKYDGQIKSDASFVKSNLDKLPSEVKSAAKDYSKKSKNFKL